MSQPLECASHTWVTEHLLLWCVLEERNQAHCKTNHLPETSAQFLNSATVGRVRKGWMRRKVGVPLFVPPSRFIPLSACYQLLLRILDFWKHIPGHPSLPRHLECIHVSDPWKEMWLSVLEPPSEQSLRVLQKRSSVSLLTDISSTQCTVYTLLPCQVASSYY